MQEYLAFVDEIGKTSDGKYIYRFDYTTNTDVVWGDYFNIAPAIIVPDLQPDINCLSSRCNVIFNHKMEIAKKNSCFSMQDCIDGIISLIFSDIDNDYDEINDKPVFFKFGEERELIENELKSINVDITNIEEVKSGDDSAINELINTDVLSDNNGDNYDEF